jgi:hypothetical protein
MGLGGPSATYGPAELVLLRVILALILRIVRALGSDRTRS